VPLRSESRIVALSVPRATICVNDAVTRELMPSMQVEIARDPAVRSFPYMTIPCDASVAHTTGGIDVVADFSYSPSVLAAWLVCCTSSRQISMHTRRTYHLGTRVRAGSKGVGSKATSPFRGPSEKPRLLP